MKEKKVMDETELLDSISKEEQKAIQDACKALRGYEKQIKNCLAQLVASLCGISTMELLQDTTRVPIKHARWLYWYAYKQMTKESCKSISKMSDKYKHFHTSSITSGITQMSMMISREPIWAKRWDIIKRVIKSINEVKDKDLTIKIRHPQGIKVELKQE